jgi:hypothetical protein
LRLSPEIVLRPVVLGGCGTEAFFLRNKGQEMCGRVVVHKRDVWEGGCSQEGCVGGWLFTRGIDARRAQADDTHFG